jgi:hypothetical protein
MPVTKYNIDEVLNNARIVFTRSEHPEPPPAQEEAPDPGIYDQAYIERLQRQAILNSLSADERAVYDRVPTGEGVYLDEVVDDVYTPQFVFPTLTMLEVKGLLKLLPGGRYVKIE